MSSTFGTLLKLTTFGESHCKAVGAVLDGCPSNLTLNEEDIQVQLDRRRPGQSDLSTDRNEADRVQILSGVEGGKTLGTPIAMIVKNKDMLPSDYKGFSDIPRPSHADFTYQKKYGIRASSGGGRSSARETIGRVLGGAVTEKFLKEQYGIVIVAWVSKVGDIVANETDHSLISREIVDAHPTRCPDLSKADKMAGLIKTMKDQKDSIGGVVSCVCRNLPLGLGEPIFDKFEAVLAQAMLSIPATKGFEIGSGFSASGMKGGEHNDPFVLKGNTLGTVTNHSGGVQGGITNGESVYFRVGFKPPATIGLPQKTARFNGEKGLLEAKGRHDPCIVPRAVPVVEAMAALTIGDFVLRQKMRSLTP